MIVRAGRLPTTTTKGSRTRGCGAILAMLVQNITDGNGGYQLEGKTC